MKLGTHMPGGERRKPIDIEDRRIKVKVTTSKNRTKMLYFFVSAQYPKYKKLSTHMHHTAKTKIQNYITRHCPSICSQLGFPDFSLYSDMHTILQVCAANSFKII